ncbi:rhomboid family intramembrane serine protease [Pedobacter boryungensis]|uniref:Rhomboid family intramembrane serine protease n=1 Tax=Pedobacter boryungensis TaxID=869962 RepID=A0ABX2DH24_9SPHI|nr:rhomboid family intramembrane serine protease [Pedobacter boryungensis]NQX32601.1 rhomboid family intramembrane serine protease [Pedobacter boryungensis]
MNNIHIPPVVKNLLIINVIFFIATLVFSNNGSYTLVQYLAVFYFDSPSFRFWQPITYMFMHSPVDYFHIIFNMFALYSFGSILEQRWGAKRFLIFYFITGLGALALQWAVQAYEVYSVLGSATFDVSQSINVTQDKMELLSSIYYGPMLGASGAIFGLLVAFGMLYPNAELFIMFIPVPVKAKYIMPIYVLVELFLGVGKFQGSVAHFAHLGGALIGFILVKLWKDKNTFYNYYE